jgi:serine/threonine protein kinase
MSPESYFLSQNSFYSDYWSVGVILYQMCCYKFPFKDDKEFKMGKFEQKNLYHYSKNFSNFIIHVLKLLLEPDT